jgi:hypothetical protein
MHPSLIKSVRIHSGNSISGRSIVIVNWSRYQLSSQPPFRNLEYLFVVSPWLPDAAVLYELDCDIERLIATTLYHSAHVSRICERSPSLLGFYNNCQAMSTKMETRIERLGHRRCALSSTDRRRRLSWKRGLAILASKRQNYHLGWSPRAGGKGGI